MQAVAVMQTTRATKERAREMGLSAVIGGTPGSLDAITDVAGVEVGHTTLISGTGRLDVGKGPVRTGVTIVHPARQVLERSSVCRVVHAERQRRDDGYDLAPESWIPRRAHRHHQHPQRRRGARRDLQWQAKRPGLQPWGLPVVAETYDGGLNDINGFHVTGSTSSPRSMARRPARCSKGTSAAAPV